MPQIVQRGASVELRTKVHEYFRFEGKYSTINLVQRAFESMRGSLVVEL